MSKYFIDQLVLGDKLYRYVHLGGMFEYTVIEIRKREGEPQQIVARCESCHHGWHCQVLLAQNSMGDIICVALLNDDEDNSQGCWHTQGEHDYVFRRTKRESFIDVYTRNIKLLQEKVANTEARLVRAREELAEEEARLKSFNEIL